MKHFFSIIMAVLMLASCDNLTNNNSTDNNSTDNNTTVTNDIESTRVVIQPYKGIPKSTVEQLKKDLEKNLADYAHTTISSIEILPEIELTPDLKNDAGTRYRAEKILRKNNEAYKKGTVMISVTKEDISTTLHGQADFGIRGLSFTNGKGCVASTYRCNNANPFWKVVTHEFIHTYWKRLHCVKDDPKCIMQDAKGKGYLKEATGLCDACVKDLKH